MFTNALRSTRNSLIGALSSNFGLQLKPPLFVIGSGRCGSTLLNRIMNSHAQLVGYPGEANELWHPLSYPYAQKVIETPMIVEDPARFTELSIAAWPVGHAEKVQNAFRSFNIDSGYRETFFVKSAMISFMVPHILELWPNARFIHIYRSGPPVVESFLKKEWHKCSDHFVEHSVYRRHCAAYWNACILEIEHQRKALQLQEKGIFLEVGYERLCDQPQTVFNEIADFIGVDRDKYGFDISTISSKNYKVGDYASDPEWHELLEIMEPGMRLMGYAD